MGATCRDRQVLGQHDGKRLEHQGVARRPEIDLLAVLERDPGEQAEAIAARGQCRLEPILLPRPTLSEQSHVGVSGIIPSPPAQLVIGCVQNVIRSEFCQDRHVRYRTNFRTPQLPLMAEGVEKVRSEPSPGVRF